MYKSIAFATNRRILACIMIVHFREKGLFQCPPLQGRWPEGPEGFPTHVSFRKANKRVVTTPQGKQKGIMAAARRTEGALRPRGRETPSAPPGLVPLRGGTAWAAAWRTEGALRPRAEFIKSPLNSTAPLSCPR